MFWNVSWAKTVNRNKVVHHSVVVSVWAYLASPFSNSSYIKPTAQVVQQSVPRSKKKTIFRGFFISEGKKIKMKLLSSKSSWEVVFKCHKQVRDHTLHFKKSFPNLPLHHTYPGRHKQPRVSHLTVSASALLIPRLVFVLWVKSQEMEAYLQIWKIQIFLLDLRLTNEADDSLL